MRGMTLTALVWICIALPPSMTRAATPAPDTILFNGKIFTAERQQFVQALAIQGGRIAAVGDSEPVRKMAGSPTKLIDLGGRVVIRSLIWPCYRRISLRCLRTIYPNRSRS